MLISMYLVLLFTSISFPTSLTLVTIISCYSAQSSTGSTDQATAARVGPPGGHEEGQTAVATQDSVQGEEQSQLHYFFFG